MATRRPSRDDRGVEREDEIHIPRRHGDIDDIGATTGDADRDEQDADDADEEDDPFDDDDTDDHEIDEEDVG